MQLTRSKSTFFRNTLLYIIRNFQRRKTIGKDVNRKEDFIMWHMTLVLYGRSKKTVVLVFCGQYAL